jgi:hypothetical protein
MRRNGARFALLSAGQRGYQTLLLRLSAVLRNAVVTYGQLITHYNYWRTTTWPEFQPSLSQGQLGVTGRRLAARRVARWRPVALGRNLTTN